MLATLLLFALPKFSATFPISPDGSRYVKFRDNSSVIWMVDARTGVVDYEFKGFKFRPYVVTFSPDGSKVAGSNKLGEVCLWNAATGKLIEKVTDADSGQISAYIPLVFSPDSKSLAVGNLWTISRTLPSKEKVATKTVISLWDATTGKQISELRSSTTLPVSRFMFVNKGRTLRVLSHSITDFDLPLGKTEGKQWPLSIQSISDDGSLASDFSPTWIKVWDVASRKLLLDIKHTNVLPPDRLIFAPDNKSFAILRKRQKSYADTGYTVTCAELWSFPEGRMLWSIPESTHNMLCFAPDGSSVLVPSLELHQVRSGKVLGTFKDTKLPILGTKSQWWNQPN